jgi:putative ABC transport system ATP-binding protein
MAPMERSVPAAPDPGSPAARTTPGGPAILCESLIRIYTVADVDVVALSGLDLRVDTGEVVAVVGASGSGKSTLMNILGGLDAPTAGRAIVAGHDVGAMREKERARYRRRVVGFVWQQAERNLLPYLDPTENVELPMLLDRVGSRERASRSAELLALVGLEPERRRLHATRLSGGEQQRTAVAIALANRPAVLLADEPTGELDTASAGELFDALRRVNRELGTTIVLVTHDPLVADHVGRTVAIRDGRTSSETLRRAGEGPGGAGTVTSEEFAVLDGSGRLQLPRAHVEALHLRRRVRLRLEDDHVGIWPDDVRTGEPATGETGAGERGAAGDAPERERGHG